MFYLFQTYVVEVLSCCNISRCRKRVYADTVPAVVAVPTCTTSEVDVWARQRACGAVPTCMRTNKHVARSCMRKCRRSSCMRRCIRGRRHSTSSWVERVRVGLWEPCMRRKIAATPAAGCCRERALLAHEGAGRAGGCSTLGRARRRRWGAPVRMDSATG
jgi:hypothetical protein